jgi:hypothetical protein
LHKVCFSIPVGGSILIAEDVITDLTTTIALNAENQVTEFPMYTTASVSRPAPTPPSPGFGTVACPQYATAPGYPVVLDYCGNPIPATLTNTVDNPDPLTCEGTRTYTYTYMPCVGNTFTYSFTYTIIYQDFVLPSDVTLEVACPDATDIPPMLPIVQDNCNNVLTPIAPPVVSAKPTCEGDRTWKYTYKDCDNNMHTWTFTYHVERQDFYPGDDQDITVNCADDADPDDVVLPMVHSNCGELLAPDGPFQDYFEEDNYDGCEGDISFTWMYTDCEGTSHPWTFVFTVERLNFTIPATLDHSIVPCAIYATAAAIDEPVVYSDCGELLIPDGPLQNHNLTDTYTNCEGTISYTWIYEDCALHHQEWTYTYTIEREDFTIPVIANSSTIECASDADPDEVTLPTVLSNCNESITPTGPVTNAFNTDTYDGCEGTISFTWTYADCANNTHTFTYTYTVDHTIAPTEVGDPVPTSSTVECIADAVLPELPDVHAYCADGGDINVLLITAVDETWAEEVRQKMAGTGAFGTVNVFDARYATPSLALMQNYNAVMVFSDYSWADPTTLGNNLAAYVDLGGGVVVSAFADANLPPGGAWNNTYRVAVPSGFTCCTQHYMGTVQMPAHPVMIGVSTFDGGMNSWRSTATSLTPNSYRIADWDDGIFLIAANDMAGASGTHKRVDIGFYPPSIDSRYDFWNTASDGVEIMRNALLYVATPGDKLSPSSVVVTDSPVSLTCEGTRTYTVTYEDCSGLEYEWEYIYTIEHETQSYSSCKWIEYSILSDDAERLLLLLLYQDSAIMGSLGTHGIIYLVHIRIGKAPRPMLLHWEDTSPLFPMLRKMQ